MAEFFSRIFAIPSDSSSFSGDELAAAGGGATASRSDGTPVSSSTSKSKKKGHARTLTPLSAGEDGTTTLLSTSQGPSLGNSATGASDDSSSSSETMEERNHARGKHTVSSRGRQRRHDDEQRRYGSQNKKSHRSSSTSRMVLDVKQNNGTKQHSKSRRSLSRLGKKSSAKPVEPKLSRVNSWSSGDSSQNQLLPAHHHANAKDANAIKQATSPTNSYQPKNSVEHTHDSINDKDFSSNTTSSPHHHTKKSSSSPRHHSGVLKQVKKKDWRSKLTGGMMKKHLSPGTATSTTATRTPPTPSDAKKSHETSNANKITNSKTHGKEQKNSTKNVHNREENKHNQQEETRLNFPPHHRPAPINVGDSIVISQQFLEESMDISVLTLPRELAMKEEGVLFDGVIKPLEVGQKRVMGNDLVRDFLDRQGQGLQMQQQHRQRQQHQQRQRQKRSGKGGLGYMDKLEEAGSGADDNNGDGDGVNAPLINYERISAYASRLLEEGNVYHNLIQSIDQEVDVDGIEVQPSFHQELHAEEIDPTSLKHVWPCDPTVDGYSPRGSDVGSGDKMFPFPPPPPPPGPPTPRSRHHGPNIPKQQQSFANTTTHFDFIRNKNSIDDPAGMDPSGVLLASPTALQSQSFENSGYDANNHQSDPPGDFSPMDENSGGSAAQSQTKPQYQTQNEEPASNNNTKSARSYKAVTFCLPPSSHPPAPPFMGPPMDFYYSMERVKNNPLPSWSSSHLMPPIIELWSSVENVECSPDVIDGSIGCAWNEIKENDLVGEDLHFEVSEKWIDVYDAMAASREEDLNPFHLSAVKEESMTSNHNYFNDLLNCVEEDDGDKNVADVDAGIDSLKINPSTDSHGSSQYSSNNHKLTQHDHATGITSSPSDDLTADGANHRHRSSWRSSHGNLNYKPPTFNSGSPTKTHAKDKGAKANTQSELDGSIPFDDPFLHDRHQRPGHDIGQRQPDNARPETLHGRLLRARRLVASSSKYGTSFSRTLSRSSSSLGSQSSSPAAMANAAISIQACTRGLLDRQFCNQLLDCAFVIQRLARRFLCRKRYLDELKLKRSYFPNKWKIRTTHGHNN